MGERQFGPYRLIRQIAVGGMAELHLAKTKGIAGFEKYVALKMIHPNFAEDEQFIQMLIDEAKIAVQLQHVNIAQTFDLGRVGDHYYITMEFVDGADLYKILRRGSEQELDVPLDVCAYIAKEVATGLDYAHRKRDMSGQPMGIVHRDVSPQNVLVSHSGEIKLVDFGIAKATMKVRQTAVGVIKGKYYYMSPEQAWGDPVDPRSDIFSAGIVLYEMITGQMLYLEEDLQRLLEMVRRADIASPSTLRKNIPPQLERIVMHALAKNPEDRYQHAVDFATDLERFLHGYSPVFTATKIASYLRHVLGDQNAPPEDLAEQRNPLLGTQPIDNDELLHDRSELRDENSVIFRMDALKKKQSADEAAARARQGRSSSVPRPLKAESTAPVGDRLPLPPPLADNGARRTPRPGGEKTPLPRITRRDPTLPPPAASASKRNPGETTRQVDPDSVGPDSTDPWIGRDEDQGGEHTLITAPPRFGTEPGSDLRGENTQIDARVPAAELYDDGPTTQRPPMAMGGGRPRTTPPPSAASASSAAAAAPTVRSGRSSPPPALAARTATPAVSEVRQRRESRRTPAEGHPVPSVLQAIVSSAGSEPMPHPGNQAGNHPGTPSATARAESSIRATAPPSHGASGGPVLPAPSSGAPFHSPQSTDTPAQATVPWPGAYPTPQGGHGYPPQGYPLPGYPPQPYYPGYPGNSPWPVPGGESEESQYRIRSQSRRWLELVVIGLLVISGAAAATYFIIRATGEEKPVGNLIIDSVPTGATVFIDDARLDTLTPVTFANTRPGARHEVRVELPRHAVFHQSVIVPTRGGDLRVTAVMQSITGKLYLSSEPARAEVYIKGERRGLTPFELDDVEMETTKEVELRHAAHGSRVIPLIWPKDGVLKTHIVFKK
jgi:serine/threonine protein kinase